MNVVLNFLAQNWQRLQLEHLGSPHTLSSRVVTPRFRASSHVIFFIMAKGATQPCLVAKLPRLPGDHQRLDREAANLAKIQSVRPGGFASIPHLFTYEDFAGHRLLLESAFVGETLSAKLRQQRADSYLAIATAWLIDLHQNTRVSNGEELNWRTRLIEEPLQQLLAVASLTKDEVQMLEKTGSFADVLDKAQFPLVFEHSDLGPPNLLFGPDKQLGVVDWELAEPRGLPAADLFFLITLVSPAWQKAQSIADYVAAFHATFFGPSAWARPYITRYAESLQLTPDLLTPLFVLSWGKYVCNLVARLHSSDDSNSVFGEQTLAWLRANRYYAVWRHTLEHSHELNFSN